MVCAACIRVQCIHTASRYSADLGCSEWLNELLLPFYGLEPVFLFWPLTLDINKTFPTTQLPPTGYFPLWGSSSVNTRDGCAAVKFPADQQQFAKHSDHRQRLESLLNLSCLLFVLKRNWEFLLMNLVVRVKKCGILLLFLLLVFFACHSEVITVNSVTVSKFGICWGSLHLTCTQSGHKNHRWNLPPFSTHSVSSLLNTLWGVQMCQPGFFSEASTSSVA